MFLHNHVVPERVFARIVGLKACLGDRPVCAGLCNSVARTAKAVPHEEEK